MKYRICNLVALAIFTIPLHAQTPRIDPAGIEGALLLSGSYKVTPEQIGRFVELAGSAKAKIVILTFEKAPYGAPPRELLDAAVRKHDGATLTIIDFAEAAKKFPEATGLWIHVDSVSPMPAALKDGMLAEKCQAILKRGGVIGSAAAGVRYLGSRELARNGTTCMKLLPESIVEIRQKGKPSKFGTKGLGAWKDLVAYEIDPDAAMLVKGRTISIIGDGAVHVILPPGNRKIRATVIEGKVKEDLTVLRRALNDRLHAFPPRVPEPPVVEKGTLVIVGGGGQPEGLTKKFVDLAGGAGKANIVVFPTANADPLPKREQIAAGFRKAGAKKATVLYAQKLADVESKEFLDALKDATGIWFDGGRQWRFVDCYEDTKAMPLMFDVLKRGGVIGGTSAGATIQGEYLCRGGVFNNFDIRYEGYERGLGFLKGVAIDQHFSQRKRQADMTSLMKIYPQYLGIGIDEATAIVVKGQVADVIGKGKVHFYDARRKVDAGEPDYQALSAGGRYDLKDRKVLTAEK